MCAPWTGRKLDYCAWFRPIGPLSKKVCSTESKKPPRGTAEASGVSVSLLQQNHSLHGPKRSSCRQGPEIPRICRLRIARPVSCYCRVSRGCFNTVRQFYGTRGGYNPKRTVRRKNESHLVTNIAVSSRGKLPSRVCSDDFAWTNDYRHMTVALQ